MPLYDYICDACGHTDYEYRKMANAAPIGSRELCPKCGQHHYRRTISLPHTDLREFHTPIEMYSIALNDDEEIAAFKQKCPDVEVSSDPDDPLYGVPIARNRKQKLAALRVFGYVEKN